MKDNRAVLEFLSSAGLKRSGDLVELPSESFTKEVDRSARTIVVTISTSARDRAGDIVEPKGVRLERYLKNPVVLWAHDYTQRPVARSLWVRTKGLSVIAKPRFHDSSDLAREVWSLYAEGYLNAWSIGFIPEDWEEEGKGFRVTKWDLLEYSAVPIPANPEALTLALKEKRITSPLLCKALGAALPDLVPHEVAAGEPGDTMRPLGEPHEVAAGEQATGDTMPHRVPSPDELETHPAQSRQEIELYRGEPGISADLSRKIAHIVREEVRGEIRRLKGSLDPYRKEKGK